MSKKEEYMLTDWLHLDEKQKEKITEFQNNFDKEFDKLIIFKLPKEFNNTAHRMFIHNEICYSRKFSEYVCDNNPSYFGNYFIIQICFLIFSSIQVISCIYSDEIDWE